MTKLEEIVDFLKKNDIFLTTAESCTAGLMVSELARVPGSGGCIDCGLVVYSPEAKSRYLKVNSKTIERYGLTSEEVALEMAIGALSRNNASMALANTGVAGPSGVDDGTPIGRVCFAWAISVHGNDVCKFTETRDFSGNRNEVRLIAAHYALTRVPHYFDKAMAHSRNDQ